MSEEQFSNVQSPQPPYAPPQSGGSGLATTSLVLGILSYLCCGPVCGIPAIITGHIALGKVRRGESPPSAKGLAIAGLVLGYVNLAVTAGIFLFYLVFGGLAAIAPFIYQT